MVLLANGNRNLNRLLLKFGLDPIPAMQCAKAPPSDGPISEKTPTRVIVVPEKLIDVSDLMPPITFRRTIRRSPESICTVLQKKGLLNGDWTVANLGDQAWECSNETPVAGDKESEFGEGSLYISVRGLQRDKVSSIRLKINFLSGVISDILLRRSVNAAADILSAIGWGSDPELLRARFESC